MTNNPALGVLLHAIGGFAAGSFYAPLKHVQRWSWESFWLVMGLAAWLAAPWGVALITTADLYGVLAASPARAWAFCLLFGLLWGLGNLTFGLSVRFLGMALGYSVALGFCMTFGTLVPPIAEGKLMAILGTTSGIVILGGVILCLSGIGLCGWAGMSKERELTDEQKQAAVSEFNLGRGFGVAAMAGNPERLLRVWAGRRQADCGTVDCARHAAHLLEQRGAGRDLDRWLCEQRRMVSDSELPQPQLRRLLPRSGPSAAAQLLPFGPGRRDLVRPVFLLRHGHHPARREVWLLELVDSHGVHHRVQQPVGDRLSRVARHQPQDQDARLGRHLDVECLGHGDRQRQLPRRMIHRTDPAAHHTALDGPRRLAQ